MEKLDIFRRLNQQFKALSFSVPNIAQPKINLQMFFTVTHSARFEVPWRAY